MVDFELSMILRLREGMNNSRKKLGAWLVICGSLLLDCPTQTMRYFSGKSFEITTGLHRFSLKSPQMGNNFITLEYWTSWWIIQPNWKICSSHCLILPGIGAKITNIWNHHLLKCSVAFTWDESKTLAYFCRSLKTPQALSPGPLSFHPIILSLPSVQLSSW